MQQVVVTGATGFIGRRLAQKYSDAGCGVTTIGRRRVDGPWKKFQEVDIASKDAVFDLEGTSVVYHLASKAHAIAETSKSRDEYRDVIVSGTRRLVRAAELAGIKSFIYMSSVKAMGEGDFSGVPIGEDCHDLPKTLYGQCKLEAEKIVLASRIPHVAVLRPVMVYGPGHKGNLVRMANAIRKHYFPPVQDNDNRRSIVHVDDVVEACIAASEKCVANREIFIIAGNQQFSTRELYDRLRNEMGMSPISWYIPSIFLRAVAKTGDLLEHLFQHQMPFDTDTLMKLVGSASYDNSKSRRILGLDYLNEARQFLEEY